MEQTSIYIKERVEYRGFIVEFTFPHYYVYWNNKALWLDMDKRGCLKWIDELLTWCNE